MLNMFKVKFNAFDRALKYVEFLKNSNLVTHVYIDGLNVYFVGYFDYPGYLLEDINYIHTFIELKDDKKHQSLISA